MIPATRLLFLILGWSTLSAVIAWIATREVRGPEKFYRFMVVALLSCISTALNFLVLASGGR